MSKGSLTSLLSQLNVQSSNSQHSEVEATCFKLLASGCTNAVAVLRQCLVALIKQDKYQQCLDTLDKYSHIDEPKRFVLEKLYAFYKLNKASDFEKLYSTVVPSLNNVLALDEASTESIRGVLHVKAQFCLKTGQYEEAVQIYQYLSSHNSHSHDNELELSCNERVPFSSLPNTNYKLATQLNEESYDLLFNESMILTAKGCYDDSLELLTKARSLAIDEDFEEDITAISLQIAYVNQLMGNNAVSKDILKKLVENLPPGSPTYLLAVNNLKSFFDFSKFTTNFSLLLRELNAEKLNSLNVSKFTHGQWCLLQSNLAFLQLFNNSSIQSKHTVLSRTLNNYQKLVDNVVLEPYKTQAKKLYHHVIKIMKGGVQGSVIGILLLAVQLQVLEKQTDKAIELCELFFNKFPADSLTYEQRVISYVLFQLYQASHRGHSKSLLLKKLYEHFSSDEVAKDIVFWKSIGFKFLSQGSTKEATDIFSEVLKLNSDDQLLASVVNQHASEQTITDEVESLIHGIDVDELIRAGSTPFESKKLHLKRQRLGRVQKNKRVHKNRKLPKSFDPEKLPDSERWLPLKDRTSYKPKKKQLAKQTQGGAVNRKEEQSLDISKKKKKQIKQGKKGRK